MKKKIITLSKGVLAGISIGVGSFLYILFRFLISGSGGAILGSLFFSVGLICVCIFHFDLFTGKVGQVFEKRQNKDFYISLIIMYIGNIIGAVGLGYISFAIFNNNDLFKVAKEIAESKLKYGSVGDVLSNFVLSTICGLCVYSAVKSFSLDVLKFKGIFFLIFFVFAFVFTSGKHCVANMYYYAISNKFGESYLPYIDIILCSIFNSVGSILGVMQYKLYTKEKTN